MNLQPVSQDPQKWIAFYKSTMDGTLRKKKVQRGRGGTLGPWIKGRGGYATVKEVMKQPVVTPTEQVVQQAKSEVKRRQQYKKKTPFIRKIRTTQTIKGKGSKTKTRIQKKSKKYKKL